MQKIKMILVISEENLKNDKNEISNFIRNLNDIYEDYGVYIRLITDEKELNEEDLNDSDLFLILVQSDMDQKSTQKFNQAYTKFKEYHNPKIATYIKQTDNVNQTVLDFMKYLDEELGHFYTNYNNIDTIKLNIAMQLQSLGFKEQNFDVKDGKLIFQNKEIMSLEKIPMVLNNKEINKLKEQYYQIENEYWTLKEKRNENPNDDDLLEKYLQAKNKKDEISKSIQDIELSMINFEKTFIEDFGKGQLSKRQIYAKKCLEQGNIEEAKSVLDFNEIKKDIDKISKSDQQNKIKINSLLRELYQKIDILRMVKQKEKKEIERTYEEIINTQKQYGLNREGQYFYACYMLEEKEYEKALGLVESYFYYLKANNIESIDTYTYKLYAECLLKNQKLDQAIENYENVRKIYYQRKELDWHESKDLFNTTYQIANIYKLQNKIDQAIEYYTSCMKINGPIHQKLETRKYNYLNLVLHYNIGYLYQKLNNIIEAEQNYLNCEKTLEKLIQESNVYEKYFFEIYHNIAIFYKETNQREKSEDYYRKTITILKKLTTYPLNVLDFIDYAFDHLYEGVSNINFYAEMDENTDIYSEYELINIPKTIDKRSYYNDRLNTITKEYEELKKENNNKN